MTENFKVRMIKTPPYEEEPMFIVLDKFGPIQKNGKSPKYFMACRLYEGEIVNGKIIAKGMEIPYDKLELRIIGNGAILRHEEDVFELPTPIEYMKLFSLMKQHGYFYNRKTHQLIKNGKST